MKLPLLLMMPLLLMGCLGSRAPEAEVVLQTEYAKQNIPIQERPKAVQFPPVDWYVVTEDNLEEKLAELDNDPYEAGQAVIDELASNGFVGTIDIYALGTGRSLEGDMESLQSAYEKQGMSSKKAKEKVDDWYDNWLN